MHRVALVALVSLFVLHGTTRFAAAAQVQGATGALQGVAQSSTGEVFSNVTVQLRNVQTGQLAGSTTTNAAGSFSFTGLNPANYVVEIVNQAGTIIGTSSVVSVTAGAAVAATVTAAAVGVGAATAAGISTAVIVATAAAWAGVVGTVVAANQGEASPSR